MKHSICYKCLLSMGNIHHYILHLLFEKAKKMEMEKTKRGGFLEGGWFEVSETTIRTSTNCCCPYCDSKNYQQADNEYPIMECLDCQERFWSE